MGKIKDKRFTEAIRRALMREVEMEGPSGEARRTLALDALAQTLIARGIAGDVTAIKEIGDRIEGKPTQALEADVNANISLVDALIAAGQAEKAAAAREAEGQDHDEGE